MAMQREQDFVWGGSPGLEKWIFTTWDAEAPLDPHQCLALTFLRPGVEFIRSVLGHEKLLNVFNITES